jgi:MFS family permease
MIVTMEIPLNSITAHWPHRRTHALGALLFAVGFGALAFVHSVAQVGACIAIWTMGEMLLFSGMSAYVSGIAPEGRHGEYMGLYTMTFSLSFMVAPPIGTFLLEHFGSTVLWAGMCGIGLLSVGVLGRRSIERQ